MPNICIQPITKDPLKVHLSRIASVYFEHPDLDKFAQLALDFGFVEKYRTKDTIYFRGYGKGPFVYVASARGDSVVRHSLRPRRTRLTRRLKWTPSSWHLSSTLSAEEISSPSTGRTTPFLKSSTAS
ncbi:hypothetical protein EDB80DRAFT_730122 [Ilyonectria destructans]|nr:hypothetical protein EDB80DRAFT_730122 [Ilyonectria destructans]